MKVLGTLVAFFICLHQHYGHSAEIEENAAQNHDGPMVRSTRGLNMLRLGRSMNFRTRGVRMLRLGKRADPLDTLTYDDLKDLLYSLYSPEKHPMERHPPIPRYGRELDIDNSVDKRMSPQLALQLLEAEEYGDHLKPVPRLGRFKRSSSEDSDKPMEDENKDSEFRELSEDFDRNDKEGSVRAVPIPRTGRQEGEEYEEGKEKRALNMLRLGRSMKMLRLGKRELEEAEKRGMRMLRLGKREQADDTTDKRSLKLLRLGKRENFEVPVQTRGINMLRLGRSQNDAKRSLKLLRLG